MQTISSGKPKPVHTLCLGALLSRCGCWGTLKPLLSKQSLQQETASSKKVPLPCPLPNYMGNVTSSDKEQLRARHTG